MNTPSSSFGPRLLAGVSTVALVAGVGLFAASRPAHSTGGPVPVAVTNAVQDRDSPARQPVEASIAILEDSVASANNLVYTVPAGKRLVVQSMTLISNAGSYAGIVDNVDSVGNVVSHASLTTGVNTGVFPTTTQPMNLHVEPGGKVVIGVDESGDFKVNALVSLSGYLVDVP